MIFFINSGKENSDFLSSIKNINTYFLSKQIKLEIMDDFHVSLTRTVILRHHWIEGFTALVKKQLSDIERLGSSFNFLKS